MGTRIGIYARISLDWEGTGLGVTRQQEDARRLSEIRGWEVRDCYVDNNISAYKQVERPQFERLLADLEAGVIDGIVAYDLDRISRRPDQLERIIRIYEERPGLVFATVQGDIDLSTSDGLTMARVMVSFANKASMDTSRRTKRKNLERAQHGLPHGSHRPFGYEADLTSLHPAESKVVREIGGRIAAGESFRDVAYLLNARSITTAQGKQWYPITIRNMLLKKRYVGVREHLGQEYPATWPPIFTQDEWEHLQAVMKLASEQHAGKQPRRYLLTGLLICGKCGAYLNGETKRDPVNKYQPTRELRPVYVCRVQGDAQPQGGCGGVTRNATAVDAHVRDAVLDRLDAPDMASLVDTATGEGLKLSKLVYDRDELGARLLGLLDDYTDSTLSKDEYLRAKRRVESAQDALKREIDALHHSKLNVRLRSGQTLRQAWDANEDGWRRRLIASVVESVVIRPSVKKPLVMVDGVRMRFDRNAVEIVWR